MVADGVVVPMVTVCAERYVPPAGLKDGAAAGGVIVYAAELAELAESPVAMAMAAIVSLVETVIGPAYTSELVVGVVPLVV
jgi:hypothetical protein